MAASSDWTTRLLSLFASESLPTKKQKELAGGLVNDPDPTVKAAAVATVEYLNQAGSTAQTQPAQESPAK